MARPSTNGGNGRTAAGRFAPGNPGGPGNPYARRVAAMRRVLVGSVTAEDLAELVKAMLDRAKAGDMAACKLLLSYLVGQPAPGAPSPDPDKLTEHEWNVHQSCPTPRALWLDEQARDWTGPDVMDRLAFDPFAPMSDKEAKAELRRRMDARQGAVSATEHAPDPGGNGAARPETAAREPE